MKGFVANIEQESEKNEFFRKVLFTAPHSQLVVMSVPGEIGMEVHPANDQFIRIEEGSGKAIFDGEESMLEGGSAVVIPAGTEHNIVNTGEGSLKLYTIYSPAHHPDGTIHKTREEAMAAEKQSDESLNTNRRE